ncbi:hypothetical protein OAG60_01725 [bacterium]|nr:hypothetical protein [bacterium]
MIADCVFVETTDTVTPLANHWCIGPDMMADENRSPPREYWAFQLGRLIAQLPRSVEYAFFHDSDQLEPVAYFERQPHLEDQFQYIAWVFSELREAITQLRDNGPSNLRKAAEDALESLKAFEKLIMDSLQNGASAEVVEHFSELHDICLPQQDRKYDDSPLTDFIAKFREDEGERRLENRGRGRPGENQDNVSENQDTVSENQDTVFENQDTVSENQDTVSENHFPFRSGSWKKLNKDLETLQSRLGKHSVFFNVGKKLDNAREKWFLKSKPPHDTKSHTRFNREVRRLVEEQLSVISDLGIDVTKLASKDASDDNFEMQVHTRIKEIEDQLRCGGSDLAAPKESLPEFRTMDSLTWDEVTITIRNTRSCDELLEESNVLAAAESRFSISARGTNVIYTATELHLVKANSPGTAKQSLMTLLKFALFGGKISWVKIKEMSMHHSVQGTIPERDRPPVDKKHIQGLCTELERIFGIEEAPIPRYDKKNGYQLLCKIKYEEVN